MGALLSNNAIGVLAAGISAGDTSVTVNSGQGALFPLPSAGPVQEYFYATLVDAALNYEIVACTARSTDTLTIVRAQDGTTARAFSAGDRIELRPVAQLFRENFFPGGTKMLFAQSFAPIGWTKDTTHDNKALRVVSGSAGSGGSTPFTSVFTSRTPLGYTGYTYLTIDQIPSHQHVQTISTNGTRGFGTDGTFAVAGGDEITANQTDGGEVRNLTSATGGSNGHDHTWTGFSMDFAVQYVDVIIATKG